MLKKFLIVSLVSLVLLPIGITAQDKKSDKKDKDAKQTPVEIKANVLVSDEKNQLVGDVKKEDIKVFEDGTEQKITYFAEKKPVLNLGIIVDNSGSMRPSFDEIIRACSYVATNLRDMDEAFIIRFVDRTMIEIVENWSSDRSKLIDACNRLYIEGGQSAVLDAVYLSAEKLLERAKEDTSKRYALLLISDVEERDSYYDFAQTVNLFKETDSQLFILSYAELAPKKKKFARSLSHSLSLETGGTIYTLDKKHKREELQKALEKIIIEMRSNYVIGYTPTNQNRDGLPRKLTVQIADDADGNKRSGLMREEYIVPKK